MTTSQTTETLGVRKVTDAEVDEFSRQGWARLPGLISPELAGSICARAQAVMGQNADEFASREGVDRPELTFFANYYRPDKDDDLCRQLSHAREVGENAARLLRTTNGIRLLSTIWAAKLAQSAQTKGVGKAATFPHQDGYGIMPVRARSLSFWIALVEITPRMGSMVFRSGSHSLGGLTDPLENWTALDSYPFSSPLHLMPGDATVHNSDVIHAAPQNLGTDPRWAFIMTYFPANALFSGMPSLLTDSAFAVGDLSIGQPFDHPDFPLIYPGCAEPA